MSLLSVGLCLNSTHVLCSCKDLATQNALLYQHLDTVSSQAARIRQVADSSAESTSGEVDVSGDMDTKLSELRSVVAYLRKEKEIVDLQLELSKQENVRLKAQIDHLTQSLQEARTTLTEVDTHSLCGIQFRDTPFSAGTRASCPGCYFRCSAC